MQMLEFDRSFAARTKNIHLGIEGDQRDCEITRIDRNTGFAPAQERVTPIDAFPGGAAAALYVGADR